MADTLKVPNFGIQCDWDEVLLKSNSGGPCWISARNFNQDKSTQGELKRTSSTASANLEISASEPFAVVKEKTNSRCLTVKDTQSKCECSYIAPGSVLESVHKSSIVSLDVSEGGLGVSVCTNNALKIWETDTGNVRRVLEGHVIDAYHCRFFPSGVVILSGGADCCLKIWSAETGDCPVTLKGHKGAIQDTSIVERGRNVISVSKDGSAKLWDCGESKCLATLTTGNSAINSCCLLTPTKFDLGQPLDNLSEREVQTVGKLLVIGREDGKIQGISVANRKVVFSSSLPTAVNRVIQVGINSFAAGCQGGEIAIFSLENVGKPLMILSPTKTPVLDLMIHPKSKLPKQSSNSSNPLAESVNVNVNTFWVSKSDGSCILIDPSNNGSKIFQLTGPESDAVYEIKSDLDFIYTACRDGRIRKYSMKVINNLL